MRAVGLLVLAVLFPAFAHATTLVNINTADAALLDTLPGIGPVKATAIVDYRNTNGPFAHTEDIKNVSGIGDSTYATMASLITVGDTSASNVSSPDTDETAGTAPPTDSSATTPPPAESISTALININTADAALLDTLPGIGPSKAAAIVDYRIQAGLFITIEDIQEVSGIGPTTFTNIKDLITVGAVTTSSPRAVSPASPQSQPITQPATVAQPSVPVVSYEKVQTARLDEAPARQVEPVTSTNANIQENETEVSAPVATNELAAAGAALPSPSPVDTGIPEKPSVSDIFRSPWTLGLIGIIILAGGAFILL